MIILKLIFIYLSVTIAISNLTNIKFEKSLILSTGIIYISLYLFGLLNHLILGVYFVIGLSIISFIYSVFSLIKKKNVKEYIRPGLFLWLFAILALYAICMDMKPLDFDEFSHWATNLKAMHYHNVLWANNKWNGVHIVYPPLSGIIEYFALNIYGKYTDWIAYFALDFFMLNITIVALKDLKNTLEDYIKGLLYLICIFCLIYIFNFNLATMYIDLPLGLLFFSGLYISSRSNTKENKILLCIIFTLLPILKDTGLILSSIILINYFSLHILFDIIEQKKITKDDLKKCVAIVVFLVIIFSSYFSWKAYTNHYGLTADFQHDSNDIANLDLKEYFKSIVLKSNVIKNRDIVTHFYETLNNGAVIKRYPFNTIIQILLFFNVIGIVIYLKEKVDMKKKIISSLLTINIGSILYLMFLLLIFLYAFLEPEGRALASLNRYMSTFFIAFSIYYISLAIPKSKIYPMSICAIICLFGTNFIIFFKPVNKEINVLSQNSIEVSKDIQKHLNLDDKVYIVLQNTDGTDFHHIRYLISPIQTNLLYEWNVGTENNTAYLATIKLTKEEWIKKLIDEKFNYIYLSIVNEGFVELYGDMFEKDATVDTLNRSLFKIKKIGNTIKLERVDL